MNATYLLIRNSSALLSCVYPFVLLVSLPSFSILRSHQYPTTIFYMVDLQSPTIFFWHSTFSIRCTFLNRVKFLHLTNDSIYQTATLYPFFFLTLRFSRTLLEPSIHSAQQLPFQDIQLRLIRLFHYQNILSMCNYWMQ